MRKILLVVFAALLLALPLAGRWLYFHDPAAGVHRPAVPRPDLGQIAEPLFAVQPFADQPPAGTPGTVLLDLAHDNRVQIAELNVLQTRLAARQQRLVPLTDSAGLAQGLRSARALVVVSPGSAWTADEIALVERFVAKGGRLLLITDPSRYGVLFDEWGEFAGLDQDVVHVNDLASRFGLAFQPDHLYNTLENEGNYRNIRLAEFADHPLTAGLTEVVFLGAHSVAGGQQALIATSGDTRSSASERPGALAVAALGTGGAVLALGDLSFMVEPYNTLNDNDRLIANVADLLAGAERRYELQDLPYFFEDEVDLVYAGDPLLDLELLPPASSLQSLFEGQGRHLAVRGGEADDRDTLFLGLYREAGEVEPYLSAAGVTVVVTPTAEAEEQEPARPSPAASSPLTTTRPLTTTSPPPDAAEEDKAEVQLQIEALGDVLAAGTALLVLQDDGDRQVLVVLADTEQGLGRAVERLARGDLAGCLSQAGEESGPAISLALCPTQSAGAAAGQGGWQEPEAQPPPPTGEPATAPDEAAPRARILVLALDDGQGRYDNMSGAEEFVQILEKDYAVEVWSKASDGLPDLTDLAGYDLTIWTAGDMEDALGEPESGLLFGLMLQGVPVMVSGAYIGDAAERAVQRDIQVLDAGHPLARGFEAGEVVAFVEAPSGQEYEMDVLRDLDDGESDVVFARGPASEASGAPTLAAMSDAVSQVHVVFVGFPIYLLPEAARSRLVLNAATWLIGSEGG